MNRIIPTELPIIKTGWKIDGRRIYDAPEIGIVNLILKPGEIVPDHKTPMDVLFQIIAGQGTITIGNEAQVVQTGDLVVSPREIPHGLKADQDSVFSVFVIKTPNSVKSAVK